MSKCQFLSYHISALFSISIFPYSGQVSVTGQETIPFWSL